MFFRNVFQRGVDVNIGITVEVIIKPHGKAAGADNEYLLRRTGLRQPGDEIVLDKAHVTETKFRIFRHFRSAAAVHHHYFRTAVVGFFHRNRRHCVVFDDMVHFKQQAVAVKRKRRQHDEKHQDDLPAAQQPRGQKRRRGNQHHRVVDADKRHQDQRGQNRPQHRADGIHRHDPSGIVTVKTVQITA